MMTRVFLFLVGSSLAAPALAQAAPDDVVRLSPVEREAVLQAASGRDDRDLSINGLSRGVHGEIGAVVSSDGGHAVYGTTVVPLGQTGSAAFSFEQADSGHWHPH